ncbi:MAG: DUF6377 domain-containing protein [Bacteroidota bacterium]|nr:DUF6377 domain-containing protein [Bacteroidota bacterium]
MRIFLLIFLFGFFIRSAYSSPKRDSLLSELKKELTRIKFYDDQKEARIKNLKNKLGAAPKKDYLLQYDLCSKLYEEYKSHQFDSAYVYTQKLLTISRATKDVPMQYESRIKLGFILLSSGMFKETFDCLNKINTHLLNDSAKLEYYALKARAFSDLADYNNDNIYAPADNAASIKYLDSAIAIAKPNSFERLMHRGDRQIRTGQTNQTSQYYARLLDHYNHTAHQRAMVATGLSFFFQGPNQTETRVNLLTIGAINDIRSSTKETLAIFTLGQQLYIEGNIKDAYIFIQQAMNDAQYYGARLRKIKIGAVLPIVAAQKIITTENEKERFLIYFLSIAVVAILITLISFIVFIQLKRLKAKEKIIEDKNVQLSKINDRLIEDTHIKEEYIGYFFNVISGYILKLEKLKRNVERKLSIKKYDDILISVNEINIKKERETLFYTFDHIFLKIFPNFITAFNSMLKPEDQIWPKEHEVLNTDLRIFALMRLGISDNETIANILEYSVNTIYVYKMRIKAKAIVSSDQFDHKIMAIKAVDVLTKS